MALYLGKDEVNLFSGARINSDNILLQEKKVTPSESQVEVIADSDHSGLSKVTVEPISKTYIGSNIIKKTSATYTPGTQNQVIDAGQYLAENQIIAGDTNLVSGNIRSGVSIFGVSGNTNVVDTSSGNATSGQILNGYKAWVDGKEISGNITTKTTSDLTVTNATVKIPAGYYASEISKSVTTTTIATPNVSINGANGLITATNTQSAGYVSAGSKSGELQLTTKGATTITPTTSSQTAVNKNVYTTGVITVGPIPSNYINGPSSITAGDYMIGGATTSSKINGSWTDLGVYTWTIKKAGTYRFKWCMMKPAVSLGSMTVGTRLVHNGTSVYENSSFSDNVNYNSVDVICSAGDTISVQGRYEASYSTYSGYIYGVSIHTSWINPFIG